MEANLKKVEQRVHTAEHSISNDERVFTDKLRLESDERMRHDLHVRIEAASTEQSLQALHLGSAHARGIRSGEVEGVGMQRILRLTRYLTLGRRWQG